MHTESGGKRARERARTDRGWLCGSAEAEEDLCVKLRSDPWAVAGFNMFMPVPRFRDSPTFPLTAEFAPTFPQFMMINHVTGVNHG